MINALFVEFTKVFRC